MSLNLQYRVGIKRQTVQAIRKVFTSANFPEKDLANKINVELTYPIIQERYPAIYVSYTDKSVKDSGMGNFYYERNDTGELVMARQWFFEGSINLNILALDPLERDILGAAVAGMLAFGKDDPVLGLFRTYITNEEFVSIQPNFTNLYGGIETETPAPWEHENEIVYKLQYSIDVFGCFFTDPNSGSSDLITIEEIRSYPYTADQSVPQGSATQPIIIDWT